MVFAQVGDFKVKSNPAPYSSIISSGGTTIVPALGLIVQIEKGKVSGFFWDEGCVACLDKPACSEIDLAWVDGVSKKETYSTCAKSDCSKEEAGCTLKVYVYWAGTDAKGKYMESAGYRLTNFKRQNAGDIWNSMSTASGVSA